MIKQLSIKNFKVLADVPGPGRPNVEFGPLNVLIGPNGCGKSSLLQAIDFLRAFFRSSVEVYLKEHEWDFRDLVNLRQSSKRIRWELRAQIDSPEAGGSPQEFHYVVALQGRRYLCVDEERLVLSSRQPDGRATTLLERERRTCRILNRLTGGQDEIKAMGLPASLISRLDPLTDKKKYPELLQFRTWVEGFRSYLIWDPKVLRNPDRGKQDEIGPSGEHLAAVVGRLKDRKPEAFQKLVARLRRLFGARDISVSGSGWGWRTVRLHDTGRDGGEVVFNSQQMSDGILRLLAVTCMLYLDRIPTVLTLEEPENGVHPQLLREVVQILRELTQRKPPNRCQVFFTTHSPYVLDEFLDHPEEVYCMERLEPAGGATITRLSENRQLPIARDSFQRSLGEAWVTGLLGGNSK